MNDPIALMLQLGFLAVLYLFLFWIARSAVKDLSRRESPDAGPREDRASRRDEPPAGGNPRLVVVAAMGQEPGTEHPVGDGALLGRSAGAQIKIEDNFASSNHARIYARDGAVYAEDLGSTNGTYLNGRQLRGAERLRDGDTLRIGDTEFRYQD